MNSALWRRIRPAQKGVLIIWIISSLAGVGVSQYFDLGRLLLFFIGTFLALLAERLFEDWMRPEKAPSAFRWFAAVSGMSILILGLLVYSYRLTPSTLERSCFFHSNPTSALSA